MLVSGNGPRKATLSKKQPLLSLKNLHWAGFRGELALAVRRRRRIVVRQFHVEGFVNQDVAAESPEPAVVFVT